jgi:hypothetical protein
VRVDRKQGVQGACSAAPGAIAGGVHAISKSKVAWTHAPAWTISCRAPGLPTRSYEHGAFACYASLVHHPSSKQPTCCLSPPPPTVPAPGVLRIP